MSTQTKLTEWLKNSPYLSTLWNISAYEQDGANVIIPTGTSAKRSIKDRIDASGYYEADIIPLPSIYEDYQINCYRTIVENDNDFNSLSYDEVEEVIKWIEAQDEQGNFPNVGKNVVALDCYPSIPQIRGVDPDTNLTCFYITLRITLVNTAKRRYYECP